jgi:hypothetical protein
MEYTFTIPFLPPSVNEYKTPIWHLKRMILTKSVREFQVNSFKYIPTMKFEPHTKLFVYKEYHGGFHNKKDGLVKRKDGPNMDKVLDDAIFARIGIDDKYIFAWRGIKVHNPDKEFVVVTVGEQKDLDK